MDCEYQHQSFISFRRRSQSLRSDRCQNILYKAVFEHFKELDSIAVLLLTCKLFQNSSFGANFLVNFVVNIDSIDFLESVLSPSSCFSLQFVPSVHIKQSWYNVEKTERKISNFVGELVKAKYLPASLRSLTLDAATNAVISCFFGISSMAWPQLLELSLENCGVGDKDMEVITKNALQLCNVNLSRNSKISHVGLELVSKLVNITSLNLSSCDNIDDGGLEHLSKLSRITSLNLSGCSHITDVGLERLAALSGITFLNLHGCFRITDAGLEHISKLSDITALSLRTCSKVTDVGLQHLAKLSRIISLDLTFCNKITFEAKQTFRTALPNCEITDQ